MNGLPHFQQDLDDIIHELATLAALCGLRLRDPGVMDAVLHNDPRLRQGNEAAFDKMRGLLVLAFTTVEHAVESEGVGPTSAFILRALAEVDERRGLRG
ncbi:hypothetical protein [Azoarcus olearius]|uniref:Uncharacterized protein n=1 Tax=Azoarcus sp. (strain BH72) TaxID=418699 RepID=A1KC66_AZOSB|nr:hypothetical protein [Azoarcus olearius]ANQ86974.1 hypothetical protein dqs_3958 [Azoarcus olearius]CAL96422.1 Hypothetical protein azo3806 [Azoarcus olearius]